MGLFLLSFLPFVLVVSVFLSTSGLLLASEDEEVLQRNRLQLNRVIKKLMGEKRALSKAKGEERGLLVDLEEIDKKLAATEERLGILADQRDQVQSDIPQIEEQIHSGRLRVAQMHRQLKTHLRLMYGLGGQGIIKVVLSQEDSARVRQSMLYYGRLIKSRSERFREFQDSVKYLNQTIEQYQTQVAKVSELSQELTAEQQNVLERRQQRVALLAKIRQEKQVSQQKIDELLVARSSLTSFMERLSGLLASEPGQERQNDDFEQVPNAALEPKKAGKTKARETSQHKSGRPDGVQNQRNDKITNNRGSLPLPVFAEGRTRKPGLFFKTSVNSPVKAIHPALVVYADWFRGYGLLVILNHGEEIYSLYGHNRELLVEPGDSVTVNQVIAKSGDTGSLEGIPGLYFEIRRRGRPENPNRWLLASR